MCNKHNQQGFTLIEAIITILLLSVLAGISLTLMNAFKVKANQSALIYTEQLNISSCLEQIKAQSRFNGGYLTKGEITNIAATCPGNPKSTFSKVNKKLSSQDKTIIISSENSRCIGTDELCLAILKLGTTEIKYVFMHKP